MKEIKINVDNYNENSIKTIEGDNLSEVYKIYICKNKRRVNLTNKIAVMAYVDEYSSKRSNILNLNITNAAEGEIELPITNVISRENGVYACEIAIYGENNFLEQTAPFSLIVENNIFSKISNAAINSSDFHILSEAIKTTNSYGEKLKQGTEKIELQYASKLDSKANESDLVIERKRIDSIVSIPSGTPNAAELIDSRIGADGVTYDNLGNAIRTQFKNNNISTKQLRELLLKGTIDMEITSREGFLTANGSFSSDSRLHCKITNKIYCEEGWVFSYYGRAETLAVSYIMYKGNTIVKTGQNNSERVNITIPDGVDNIVFSSFNSKERDIILEVELIKPSIIIDNNLKEKLNNSINIAQLNTDLRNVFNYTDKIIGKEDMQKTEGYYANISGTTSKANGYAYYTKDVKAGDIYNYNGTVIYQLAPYHFLDVNDNVIEIGGDLEAHNVLTPFNFDFLIIPEGVAKIRLCAGNGSGETDFYFAKKEINSIITKADVDALVDTHTYTDIGNFTEVTEKYNVSKGNYINSNGNAVVDAESECTDFIDISTLDGTLYLDLQAKYQTVGIAIYNSSKSFLAVKGEPSKEHEGVVIWNKEPIDILNLKEEYPTAKFIRFCSYSFRSNPLRIYTRKTTLKDIVKQLEEKIDILGKQSNVLYGKKWVACGDSFTEGDFTGFVDEFGQSGKNSSVIYDKEMRCYKTYPWWIAKRNNMNLTNEAICGSTMALSKEYLEGTKDDINYRNPFSLSRYKKVPLDTDYLTLWFGLNETSTPLGTLQDTDNRTILGAWNIVLEYFITNMPYCKIGIVISDGGLRDEFANGIISVAEYWGIPYLDLRNDPKVPLMLGGRGGNINLNPKARELRNKAFYVTSDNGHPNLQAHKYQSTFIENWLRSL
ncbi:SGNH/GDSL hydrolase family protein [Clostridium perfringens]|nr:SGNH/GDSL hydrolase family protein [Clostridium perfringens]